MRKCTYRLTYVCSSTCRYAGNFVDEGNMDAVIADMRLLGILSETTRAVADELATIDFGDDTNSDNLVRYTSRARSFQS